MDQALSIIIPAKNEADYIGKCLDALQKAIFSVNIIVEIILVDNGSNDTTQEIASDFGCKVIELPNANISGLRNAGAHQAKGEILAFLDADCLVNKKWILFCIQALNQENVGIVGTRAIPDLENATWVEDAWFKLISGAKRPDYPEWIGTSNIFVKKIDFMKVGGFDENLETAEDVNFCYQIRKLNKLVFLDKRVDTIHLRESKTLFQLYKRELKRGSNSLRSLIRNNFDKKEIPSTVIPAFALIIPMCFIVFMLINFKLSVLFVLLYLFLPILFLIRKQPQIDNIKDVISCFIIAGVFIFSRSCSMLYEIYALFLKRK